MFGYFGSGFLRAQGQGVIDVLADVEKMSETIVKIGGVAQWYGIILLKTLRYSRQVLHYLLKYSSSSRVVQYSSS